MLTGEEVLMIEKVQMMEHSFEERGYYLGQERSIIVFLSQQQRHNMLQK